MRIGGFRRTAPYEGLARVLMRMDKPIEALEGSEYTKARVFAEAMSRRVGGENFDVPAEVLKKDEQINDQLAALKKSRQNLLLETTDMLNYCMLCLKRQYCYYRLFLFLRQDLKLLCYLELLNLQG